MGTTEFSVRWEDHSNTLSSVCKNLLDDNFLVDCTIAAEGQCLKAHRLILSACSPYFQLLFKQDNEKHPIVVLKDTKFAELKALIDFIYHGEAQISENRLGAFFHLAHSFEIKGLNDAAKNHMFSLTTETSSNNYIAASSYHIPEGSKTHPLINHSRCLEKNLCNGQETGVDRTKNSCENGPLNEPSYPSDVCTSSVKPCTFVPVKENHVSHLEQINSPSISQQHSPLVEELPSRVEQTIKFEPDESEDLKPNFELNDVEMNDETAGDLVEDEIQEMNKKIVSRHQEENINHQFPGTSSSVKNKMVSFDSVYLVPSVTSSPDILSSARKKSEILGSSYVPSSTTDYSSLQGPATTIADVLVKRMKALAELPGHDMVRRRASKGTKHRCDLCEKLFPSVWGLNRHLLSHTGERPHQCTVCPAAFTQRGHLLTHMRTHSIEKPYKCQFCNASFGSAGQCKIHLRNHVQLVGQSPVTR